MATLKPPPGALPDPSSPLAAGLVGCWLLNEGAGSHVVNLASPGVNDGALISKPTWVPGPYGPEVSFNNSLTQYADCGVIPALAGATRASVFAAGSHVGTNFWVFGVTGATGYRFNFNAYTNGNTYWQQENSGTGSYPSCTSSPDGRLTLGCGFDGSQTGLARLTPFLNGKPQSLSAGASDPATSIYGLGHWIIGAEIESNRYQQGPTTLVYLWVGRTLTAQDFAALHADPVEALFPTPTVRRFWVPAAGPPPTTTAYPAALLMGL